MGDLAEYKEPTMGNKERPILFSAPMVRAILAGQKTQTRRVIKSTVGIASVGSSSDWDAQKYHPAMQIPGIIFLDDDSRAFSLRCPYGQPGDRLWVRETFGMFKQFQDDQIHALVRGDGRADGFTPHYRATDTLEMPDGAWRPSIHMPRWASRILLEIVSVRVEQLKEIREADCHAEGAPGGHGSITGYSYAATPYEHYRQIWESINGRGSWDANPWVWVIEFKLSEQQQAKSE